jgi:three-Cys-motif partner protein
MEGSPYILANDGLLARKSGDWAKRKHHYLRNYCGITTTSMRSKFKLVYLDVMAGPGRCEVEETGDEFPGSPFVALEHDFSEFVLIEDDPDLAKALRQRISTHPKSRKVRIIDDSWISAVEAGSLKFDPYTLVVAFVDPTGISQVPLAAMRKLAASPKIDLLVTIQHRLGIVWNTPQYRKTTKGVTALDGFLGNDSWRKWEHVEASEFGRLAVEQFCNSLQKEGFINTRHVSVPEQNPLYRFTLFSRHRRAEDFWLKVLKIDERGQRELGL